MPTHKTKSRHKITKTTKNISNIGTSNTKLTKKNYELLDRQSIKLSIKQILKQGIQDQEVILARHLENIENIIQIDRLQEYFKDFFQFDYMNYLDLDIHKRDIEISRTSATYKNHKIYLEATLATIFHKNIYNSYMFSDVQIITTRDKNVKTNTKLIFPKDLPDNIKPMDTNKLVYIMEIFNQIHTILKYIAIITGHRTNKPKTVENAYALFTVRMNLYNDNSVILESCKQMDMNMLDMKLQNRYFQQWLDTIVIKPIIVDGYKIPILGISTLELYHADTNSMDKVTRTNYNKQLAIGKMTRKDFNNKFIFSSDQYKPEKFSKIAGKYGLTYTDLYTSLGTQPAMIWIETHDITRLKLFAQHYNTITYAGNAIDGCVKITDKYYLYFNLKKLFPREYKEFLAESFELNKKTPYIYINKNVIGWRIGRNDESGVIKDGNVYIARPLTLIETKTKKKKIQACSGQDIVYIYNKKSLDNAKELLDRYDRVLISEYIPNLLLFKGKKFHLRMMFLITLFDNTLKSYLLNQGAIYTAKLPFVMDYFTNMNIHDTHLKSTEGTYFYPEDFTPDNLGQPITVENKHKIWHDIIDIMNKVSYCLTRKPTARNFDNYKNGFFLLGIDIMFTKNYKPILLEINNRPGFSQSNQNENYENYENNIINFFDRNIFHPLFGNKSNQHTTQKQTNENQKNIIEKDNYYNQYKPIIIYKL